MPEISDEELQALKDSAAKAEELNTKLADVSKQFEAVNAKKEELLTEAKKAKQAKREAEEAAQAAKEAKAHADKDYENLFKSSEQKRQETQAELEETRAGIAKDKEENASLKLASELAEGDNVDLLAAFVTKRVKYTDGAIKVLDKDGNLTVSTLKELKSEFQNDPKYSALLKGNQSSGGGANGGKNGSGAAKTLTRAEFDALNHTARHKFIVEDKGKVID